MTIYLRILKYVRRYWRHLLGSLVCIIFFTLFSSASLVSIIPFLKVLFQQQSEVTLPAVDIPEVQSELESSLTQPIDRLRQALESWILTSGKLEALEKLCWVILVLILLKGVFGYLQTYFMAYVEQAVMRDIRNDLYRQLNRMDLAFFHSHRTGELISKITNDVNLINNGISAAFVTLTKNPLLILAYLLLAFYLSWQLTLAVLIVLPFGYLIIRVVGARLRKESTVSQEKMADVTSVLQETISGIRVVKAFAMEEFEIKKFVRETYSYFRSLLRMTRVRNLSSPVNEFLGTAIAVGILWFGGKQVLEGNGLAPEEFMAFLMVIFSLMQPIKELSSVSTRLHEALAAGDRIFSLMDMQPAIRNKPNAVIIDRFENDIVFEHVWFEYEAGEPVLRDISFTVAKGQVIALVGPSGAGKSTLVDLIPRFYDPTAGRILLDGHDLRDLEIKSLRRLLGIVTQETILFNDTVRNNIAYGMSGIPQEKIEEAARIANALRFIQELPHGFDTVIGDRGVKLSGGQRQRLAIARAVLKNPPILILDEATSALDSESELLVQQAIERLMENRTSFVIAHRLSTILNADRILVLDQGRIMQSGTHEELVRQRGMYRKLYEMQFRA